jgi:Ca2+-binding RTX toxin-like protein
VESFDLVSIIDLLGLDLLVSTPLSDLLVAGNPYQILWGRTGNDTIYPYEKPGLFNDILPPYDDLYSQLYVMLGDFEFPQIDQIVGFSRTGNDTFALGDWRKPFLVQDSLLSFGLSDFALLADFETSKDVLQLHGSQEDYTAIDLGFLTILLYNQEVIPGFDAVKLPNVIALALGSIDLGADYIYYTGSESPVESEPDVLQIGSTGVEVTDAMTVDSYGNIFIAGSTTGYLGPDPFGFNRGLQDGWIRKYAPDGTLLASIQLGSEGSDNIFDIVTDEEGNVYAVGNSSGSLAGAQPETFVGVDAWIARIDKDLSQVEWIQRVENDTFQDEDGEVAGSYSIELGGNGNLYISGVVEIPTPPGSAFPVETGNAIASYTKSGDLLWYRQYSWNGQTDYEETYSGALDADGNFYRAGFTTSRWPEDPDWFQSDVSLGQQAQLYDVWLTKHGPDGTPDWIRSFGTGDFDWIWGVDTDSTGNIYVGGITLGTLDDTVDSTTAQGGYDTFIAKFDALGNSVWLNQVGSNGDDQLFTLQVSPRDDLIVGGWTNGSFGSRNQGSYDAFLMSLSPKDGGVIWENTFGTARWDGVLDLAFSNEARAYALGITDSSFGARNTGAFDSWLAEFDLSTGSFVGFPGATESGLASIGPGTQQIPSGTGGPNGNATELEKLMTVPPTSQEIAAATLSRLSELTGINPSDFSEETLSSWLKILSSSFVPYGPPPPQPPPPTYNIAVTEDGQGPTTASPIQQLYLVYFGRPADPNGLSFWLSNQSATQETIAKEFAGTPEYKAKIAGKDFAQIVNGFYLSLFNRNAEPAGLNFWVNELNQGKLSTEQVGLIISNAALAQAPTTVDNISVTSKLTAAASFTAEVNKSTAGILAYSGQAGIVAGVNFLLPVSTTATIPSAAATTAAVNALIASNPGGGGSNTLDLTVFTDIFTATQGVRLSAAGIPVDSPAFRFSSADQSVIATTGTVQGNPPPGSTLQPDQLIDPSTLDNDSISFIVGGGVNSLDSMNPPGVVIANIENLIYNFQGSGFGVAGLFGVTGAIRITATGNVLDTQLFFVTDPVGVTTFDASGVTGSGTNLKGVVAGFIAVTSAATITGSAINDTINGGTKADVLSSGAGNDAILGFDGNDTITGGTGSDNLGGNAGSDRFVYLSTADGYDTIVDFTTTEDKLAITSAGFAGAAAAGTSANVAAFNVIQTTAASGANIAVGTNAQLSATFSAASANRFFLQTNILGSVTDANTLIYDGDGNFTTTGDQTLVAGGLTALASGDVNFA